MQNIKLLNFIDLKLEEHLTFIESLKSRKDKLYFLVKKEDEFIGVTDFLDLDKKEIFYGIYSNPNSKIMGVGRILNEISIDFAFNSLKAHKLKLEVFEDNIQVRNLHKKYKFRETSQKYVNNKKVICMELENENR